MQDGGYAIQGKGLVKKFGRTTALDGLDLIAERGFSRGRDLSAGLDALLAERAARTGS